MSFREIAETRQSCRAYDPARQIEDEKLRAILEAGLLSPSACNGQPYHITVCKGECAKKVAKAVMGMGMNRFASDAPVLLVISEKPYVPTAALGNRKTGIDYRSIDIGILAAYITAEASTLGIGSCILGWLDDKKIKEACGTDGSAKLVITLGYPKDGDKLHTKKRKSMDELVSFKED